MRFDPVEGCGCLIKALEIKAGDGTVLPWQPGNGQRISDGAVLFLDTTDPQILLPPLSDGCTSVEISAVIYCIE